MALKNGKTYHSRFSAYRAQIQGRNPIRWNQAGQPIEWTKELTAEFAFHNGEFKFQNTLTGAEDTAADIRGHFFDSVSQGEEKGWTQDEHDMVVARLDWIAENMPADVQVWSAPVAEAPWPTYDTVHHNQVPVLAEQLGLVEPALRYERQKQQRPSVIQKLEEILNAQQTQEELTAA